MQWKRLQEEEELLPLFGSGLRLSVLVDGSTGKRRWYL